MKHHFVTMATNFPPIMRQLAVTSDGKPPTWSEREGGPDGRQKIVSLGIKIVSLGIAIAIERPRRGLGKGTGVTAEAQGDENKVTRKLSNKMAEVIDIH